MVMQLNTKKIRDLLKDDERKLAWLARRLGISRALLDYTLKHKNIKRAPEIANILGVGPFDLIALSDEKGVADNELSKGEKLAKISALHK